MSLFFDQYAPYRALIDNGLFTQSIDEASRLLRGIKELSPQLYATAHKGTPFYIMGFAAFASRDYPTASLFFDAAAEADLRHHGGKLTTPALRFIQLLEDSASQSTLASAVVAQVTESTEILLDNYRARAGSKSISLDLLRVHFFQKILLSGRSHHRALVTTFISFVAEWPYRKGLFELVQEGSREPFFLHLFRGCLLFESLLKAAPTSAGLKTLGDALQQHKAALGLKKIETSATEFNDIVKSLTDVMDMESTITSCSKARNTLGHNLVWLTADLTAETYDLLAKNIAASCLHAISTLYP